METQTIKSIQIQISKLENLFSQFNPASYAGQLFGSESEYTPADLKAEISALLDDIRGLVGNHNKFVKSSSYNERVNILNHLETIQNYMTQQDYNSVAPQIDDLKVLIRPHHARGSSESHKKLIERTNNLNTIIAEYEDKLKQYTNAAKMGAAFTVRYNEERKKALQNSFWLIWAAVFLLAPIYEGISFLTSYEGITVGRSIARIAIMSVAIYGAWFCMARYVRYKNITEDYGYKSVLANSMVAFLEQFEGDQNKQERILYLQTVLREIFQDPLRKQHDMQHPVSDILQRVKKGAENG